MEWSNEVILEFLDLYEAEPSIWDPSHHLHDRNNVHDAWRRIEQNLSIECSIQELKKRKEILMATYRKLAKKVNKTAAIGKNYKPEWFAYDKMASFMHNIYTPRKPKHLEKVDIETDQSSDDPLFIKEERLFSPSNSFDEDESNEAAIITRLIADNLDESSTCKKRKSEEFQKAKRRLSEDILQVDIKPDVIKDESCLFCELLCLKLRSLDDDSRELAMHKINNLMFELKVSLKENIIK